MVNLVGADGDRAAEFAANRVDAGEPGIRGRQVRAEMAERVNDPCCTTAPARDIATSTLLKT
jgi:hypothetical protein